MDNFFDQFDAAPAPSAASSGNYFDQYDEEPPRGWGQALAQEAVAGTHGAQREGMGLGNIVDKVLPSSLQIPGTSNADLQNFDQTHAAEFANNRAGKILGEAAPMIAAQFIPGLDFGADAAKAAEIGGRALPMALRAASAAGQGAVQGASTAPVGQQGSAALVGGLTGGALSGAGSALTGGLVSKSAPAQRLYDLANSQGDDDFFIPLAQGGEGPIARAYQHVLPHALGAGAQMRSQAAAWQPQLRAALAKIAAAPTDADVSDAATSQAAMDATRGGYHDAYDGLFSRWGPQEPGNSPIIQGGTANVPALLNASSPSEAFSYSISVPRFQAQVARQIAQDHPSMPNSQIAKSSADVAQLLADHLDNPSGASGPAIQNAWTALGERIPDAGSRLEKQALLSAKGVLNDLRVQGFSPEDQARLTELDSGYAQFSPQAKAAAGAKPTAGAYSGAQLARAARDGTPMQQAGQDMVAVTGNKLPSGGGRTGRAVSGMGELAAAAYAPHVALPVLGAANALATKTAQRALYGDTALQQTMRALAAQNPQAINAAAAGVRAGLVGASGN